MLNLFYKIADQHIVQLYLLLLLLLLHNSAGGPVKPPAAAAAAAAADGVLFPDLPQACPS